VLVLGIGNSLLTDDGAGVHAALQLRERTGPRAGIKILDAGTLGFSLLSELEGADALIAIDAARDGGEPGAVCVREGSDFDRFVQRSSRSVHEVGLSDLLDMARLAGQLPSHRVLIGVEPKTIDWGLELTPPVAAALPHCVDVALSFIDRWRPGEVRHDS
jgi:hydrogenase maturation protease